MSWQCDGAWTEPRNLGDGINGDAKDYAPKLSPDGKYLFFTSNRSTFGEPAGRTLTTAELERRLDAPGNGLNDVYQVDVAALRLVSPCPRRRERAADATARGDRAHRLDATVPSSRLAGGTHSPDVAE